VTSNSRVRYVYDKTAEPAFCTTLAFRRISNLPVFNLRFGFEPRPAHHLTRYDFNSLRVTTFAACSQGCGNRCESDLALKWPYR
jgi:hypothetical protein